MAQVGSCEAVTQEAIDWRVQCRTDPATSWSECRVLDISLTGALVVFPDLQPVELCPGDLLFLQFDSIAGDDVGIEMRGVVCGGQEPTDGGDPVVEIEFAARREEQLLLHLLVRLHTLV